MEITATWVIAICAVISLVVTLFFTFFLRPYDKLNGKINDLANRVGEIEGRFKQSDATSGDQEKLVNLIEKMVDRT